MFLEFYHLREQPFGVTPSPHYLYLGGSHREALASLFYGVKTGRGMLALIAPPGMGKTTLLFRFLEHLRQSARTAFLFQTQCDSSGLLRYLLGDLGISTHGQDFVTMHDRLNTILIEEARAGRRFVLVIDEAQNLDDSVLETVRLLSDFETPNEKLLQIVLAGQPQLAEKLSRPELLQLRQRISILGRLRPFSPTEVSQYINHRLGVAGYNGENLFTPAAIESIALRSRGIPRNINNLCFNALSLGCALRHSQIDANLIDEVTADLELSSFTDSRQTEMQAVGSLAQLRGQDRTDGKVPTSAPAVSSHNRPAGDRSDVHEVAHTCEDESTVVLEPLEDAEQRDAEILAEVIGRDPVTEATSLRPAENVTDIDRTVEAMPEDVAEQTLAVSAVSTRTPVDESGKQPQASLGNLIARPLRDDQAAGLPVSYATERDPKIQRWAFVAATFVLVVVSPILYGQRMKVVATPMRQTLASVVRRCSVCGAIRIEPELATAQSVTAAKRVERTDHGLTVKAASSEPLTSVADHHTFLPQALEERATSANAAQTPASAQGRSVGTVTSVIVRPNDDLRRICLRYLGKFDAQLVQEIRKLNPDIRDPAYVFVGQRIVLPTSTANSTNDSASAKPEL